MLTTFFFSCFFSSSFFVSLVITISLSLCSHSTNVLEITAALSAVNKIVTEDMIPAVIGDVSHLPYTMFSIVLVMMFFVFFCG